VRRIGLVLAGVAVLIAACSSSITSTTAAPATSATATAAASTFDSCSIVTQAEASTALGQTVQSPVRGKATVEGGVACVFYGPSVPAGTDPDVPINDSVRVVLVVGSNATTWFNDYKSKVPAQTITGLGDQAYFDGSASVSVLKGDEYLRVAVIGVANFENAEKTLAQAVLPLM
jgi:lipopolysaccharide export system protein LptA